MVGLLIENKFLEKINAIFGGKLDHVQWGIAANWTQIFEVKTPPILKIFELDLANF